MNHATARAGEYNPAPTSTADADQFDSAVQNALDAVTRDAGNERNPADQPSGAFFLALKRQRAAEAPNGMDWLTSAAARPGAYAVARVDRCIAGLEGILSVLHANDLAVDDGPANALGPYLTDKLHFAARELLMTATDSMEKFRKEMGVDI